MNIDSKPTLPLETIITIVSCVPDLATLRSLLTVSRAVSEAAARRLYYDPLSMVVQTSNWSIAFEKFARMSLSRSLFAQPSPLENDTLVDPGATGFAFTMATASELAQMLSLEPMTIQEDQLSPSARPTFDYLSFIRVFAEPPVLQDNEKKATWEPNLMHHRHMFLLPFPLFDYHAGVRWQVCKGRFSQLVKVQISLLQGSVDSHMAVIPQMQHLKSIVFDARYPMQHEEFNLPFSMESRFIRAFEFVQRFVEYHGPGQLQQVEFLRANEWHSMTDPDAQPSRMQAIKDLLSVPRNRQLAPQRIDKFNWDDCLRDLNEVDLRHVHSVVLSDSTAWTQLTTRWPNKSLASFLLQCRSLEAVRCTFDANDIPDCHPMDWIAAVTAIDCDRLIQRPAAHLKVIDIVCPLRFLSELVSGALCVFGHSLEVALFRGQRTQDNQYANQADLNIAQVPTSFLPNSEVALPRLRKLNIVAHGELHLDPRLLAHCPMLDILLLTDNPHHSLRDVKHHLGFTPEVWTMPMLRILNLQGPIANRFHPQSLRTMAKLEQLELDGFHPSFQFHQPPQNHVDPLPTGEWAEEEEVTLTDDWTWDWALPNLTALEVRGRHALSFKFTFLRHCASSLERFVLAIGGTQTYPLMPDSLSQLLHDSSDDDGQGTRSCGIMSNLRILSLQGPWIVSDSALGGLLNKVARYVTIVMLFGCHGHTLKGMVQLAESHRYLRMLSDLRTLSVEEVDKVANELGMDVREYDRSEHADQWRRLDLRSLPSRDESASMSPRDINGRAAFWIYLTSERAYRFTSRGA